MWCIFSFFIQMLACKDKQNASFDSFNDDRFKDNSYTKKGIFLLRFLVVLIA